MKLPPEIREMIYFYLFIPEDRKYRSKLFQKEGESNYDDYKSGGQHTSQPQAKAFNDFSILRTSSIIYNEAMDLICKNVIYEFEARESTDDLGFQKMPVAIIQDTQADIALTRFHRFHLIVSLYNLHIDDTGINDLGIAHFFRHIQSILATRKDGVKLKLKVTFKWRNVHWDPFDAHADTFQTRFGRNHLGRMAFFRAQIYAFVSRIRSELLGQAPHVRLETNAEGDGHQVRVKRLSSDRVLYKDLEVRRRGIISPQKSGFLVEVKQKLWDGSDLDGYV